MRLLPKNSEREVDFGELPTALLDEDHTVIVLTIVTSLFAISCIALFFYYHWRVSCYLVETRIGIQGNDFIYLYYSKRS